jgi:hypothetical protein
MSILIDISVDQWLNIRHLSTAFHQHSFSEIGIIICTHSEGQTEYHVEVDLQGQTNANLRNTFNHG